MSDGVWYEFTVKASGDEGSIYGAPVEVPEDYSYDVSADSVTIDTTAPYAITVSIRNPDGTPMTIVDWGRMSRRIAARRRLRRERRSVTKR